MNNLTIKIASIGLLIFGLYGCGGSGGGDNTNVDGDSGSNDIGNKPPKSNAGLNQRVSGETVVTLDGSKSTDPDGTISHFEWKQITSFNVKLNNPTEAITTFQTPKLSKDEELIFELKVTDDKGSKSKDTVVIKVFVNPSDRDKNQPPESKAGPDQPVNPHQPVYEETVITLDGSKSTDPDGNISHFDWKQITSFELKLENPTEAITTFRAPKVSKDEELIFELKVTDDKGSESIDTVVIKVSVKPSDPGKNKPPESNAGPDQPVNLHQKIYEETVITLDGSKSIDPDGNISRFEWKQITTFKLVLKKPAEVITTFLAPKISKDEKLIFELKVTDDKGSESTDTVVIKVSANPQDPNKFLTLLSSVQKEGKDSADAYYEAIDPEGKRKTLDEWKSATDFNQDAEEEAHAVYVNALDLGFGRNMYFRRNANGTSASYVENYPTLEDAIKRENLIATVAMEHSPNIKDENKLITKFFAFDEKGERIIKLNLDGRGDKFVPGVCNVCHGGAPGKYEEGSLYPDGGDTGAHFIPWDLDNLEYGESGGLFSKNAQEKEFLTLNKLAYLTYPDPKLDPKLDPNSDSKWTGKAARDLIDGWYGGNVLTATGLFNSAFVPEGWSGHEALYKKVVQPSCQACHIMRGDNDDIDFSSFTKFMNKKLLIDAYVCGTGQMPLARLTYVKFWRDDLAVDELREFLESPECKANGK